jgi:anthranilate synthase component II
VVRVLLVDNHDSFTFNLVQLVREVPGMSCTVTPHNKIELEDVAQFDKIIFSPGPGLPEEFPSMNAILSEYSSSSSILGVCLGHQAIACHFGGKLRNLASPLHGIRSSIDLLDKESLFSGLAPTTQVGLYHSWVVDENSLPRTLNVTARTSNGLIMALSHAHHDIQGVQFHPESYMTTDGAKLLENWLRT